jgi:hypothetical protein
MLQFAPTVVATALALAVPELAYAQGQTNKGFHLAATERILLLANKSVQQELKLSVAQVQKVEPAVRQLSAKYDGKLKDAATAHKHELLRKLIEEMNDETDKALAKILSTEQGKRLWQIHLQRDQPLALLDPQIHKSLNMTADQSFKLGVIWVEASNEITKLSTTENNASEKPEKVLARIKNIREHCLSDMLATMSDEQRKLWKKMMGPPAKLDPDLYPFGGATEVRGRSFRAFVRAILSRPPNEN